MHTILFFFGGKRNISVSIYNYVVLCFVTGSDKVIQVNYCMAICKTVHGNVLRIKGIALFGKKVLKVVGEQFLWVRITPFGVAL